MPGGPPVLPSPPLPPPPSPSETYHYGPSMYLKVSQIQSHLFPVQPLGCTGVMALCASVLSCVQPIADWAQGTIALFTSLVHHWPKCLTYASWGLPHHLERRDNKFNNLLALGEGLRADTVSWVAERSHTTAMCPILIIWHTSIAYFGNVFFFFFLFRSLLRRF